MPNKTREMNTRDIFEKAIIIESHIKSEDGHAKSNKENLINGVELGMFESELRAGSGNELESKFNALYSSSALAVNSFAFLKEESGFEFLGYKNFDSLNFERKFPTGLGGSAPNLDIAFENEDAVLGFESKYLELLQKKKVKFSDSYNKEKLVYLSDFWFEMIESYKGQELFLDVAQLIKHSFGLLNYKRESNKEVVLIYIYWKPQNFSDFKEYRMHKEELDIFSNKYNSQTDIRFLTMTYNNLWDKFDFNERLKKFSKILRERYDIEIK